LDLARPDDAAPPAGGGTPTKRLAAGEREIEVERALHGKTVAHGPSVTARDAVRQFLSISLKRLLSMDVARAYHRDDASLSWIHAALCEGSRSRGCSATGTPLLGARAPRLSRRRRIRLRHRQRERAPRSSPLRGPGGLQGRANGAPARSPGSSGPW